MTCSRRKPSNEPAMKARAVSRTSTPTVWRAVPSEPPRNRSAVLRRAAPHWARPKEARDDGVEKADVTTDVDQVSVLLRRNLAGRSAHRRHKELTRAWRRRVLGRRIDVGFWVVLVLVALLVQHVPLSERWALV